MPIGYIKVKRLISVGRNPGEKFLARIFREKPIGLSEIAKRIADHSALSEGDVMSVLKNFESEMMYSLSQGKAIQLGILGNFTPAIRSKAVDSADAVTVDTIRGVKVNFRPSAELNTQMKKAGFRLVDLSVGGLQE